MEVLDGFVTSVDASLHTNRFHRYLHLDRFHELKMTMVIIIHVTTLMRSKPAYSGALGFLLDFKSATRAKIIRAEG